MTITSLLHGDSATGQKRLMKWSSMLGPTNYLTYKTQRMKQYTS